VCPNWPAAGNHAETIDYNGQIISLGVFLACRVGDQFAEAIDAALAAINRKFLRNSMDGMKTGGALLDGEVIPDVGIVLEARERFAARESVQAIGAVHPIRTPEDQGNPARAGVLENVDGAEPVIGDVEKGVRITGYDRRLRAGVANQLNASRKIPEVLWIAHIAMKKGDAVAGKSRDISFAAAAHQIIHHGNFVSRFAEMEGDVRTDKTATTGHKYVQEVVLLSGHRIAEPFVAFSHRRKSR
jgi:hypothetical protein